MMILAQDYSPLAGSPNSFFANLAGVHPLEIAEEAISIPREREMKSNRQ